MSKPSFVYWTGRDENEFASPEAFTRFAATQLGLEVPVGRLRTAFYRRLKEEMEAQHWTWDDMAKAVRYCKAHPKARPDKLWGILYQVQKARRWVEAADDFELHGKVADAIASEEDETWRRRLSIAKGKALIRVYEQWRQERGSEV